MLGCTYGTLFKTTVAGGSYQEGLSVNIQGIPPGLKFLEQDMYGELLLRKPGQGELTSPRREADVPIIYSGVNAANTMPGFANRGFSNGTPLVILIPNVDRHLEHIEQYQTTNRTPRPGHASYASFLKYGSYDDAIGAGFFSGRYTATLVAAGFVAKEILARHGILVTAYIKEAAGIKMPDMDINEIRQKAAIFRRIHCQYDPVFQEIFASGKWSENLRFFDKISLLVELEKKIPDLTGLPMDEEKIKQENQIHPRLFCPHLPSADAMADEIINISRQGDSSGGVVEVVISNLPGGMGEPVFNKMDGELGRLLSIAAVKGVEIGCGFKAATMKGSECNDQIRMKNNRVVFSSNHAGGITGGLTTGQDVIARVTVKPTPTIAKEQFTIDKVSRENKILAAVTRRDPSIVPRIWPVVEGFSAMIVLDLLMQHLAYQTTKSSL